MEELSPEVQEAIRLIRKYVPRPGLGNVIEKYGLRGPIRFTPEPPDGVKSCPLGLLPNAPSHTPMRICWPLKVDKDTGMSEDYIPIPVVNAFAEWWDNQEDPMYAMDVVWGKEEGEGDV